MTWAVVVPSNRPDRLETFEEAWSSLFDKHDVLKFYVHDAPPWESIPDFIPKRTDMIRSWGFHQAWKTDCDYVLSLDDDVLPQGDPFAAYERAFAREWPCSEYLSVGALTDTGLEMRGFPYQGRAAEAVVQYGGWVGVPDLDAATQIQNPRDASAFYRTVVPVPKGAATTCCAMNFAFRREYAPIMWQLPMLQKHNWRSESPDSERLVCDACGEHSTHCQTRQSLNLLSPCVNGRYNRFGDIWSGLIQKRVLDALGKVMLVNGEASVVHDRASDPFVNLVKEAPGLEPNEGLWRALKYPGLSAPMVDCFRLVTNCLVAYFRKQDAAYAAHFGEARDQWLALFTS